MIQIVPFIPQEWQAVSLKWKLDMNPKISILWIAWPQRTKEQTRDPKLTQIHKKKSMEYNMLHSGIDYILMLPHSHVFVGECEWTKYHLQQNLVIDRGPHRRSWRPQGTTTTTTTLTALQGWYIGNKVHLPPIDSCFVWKVQQKHHESGGKFGKWCVMRYPFRTTPVYPISVINLQNFKQQLVKKPSKQLDVFSSFCWLKNNFAV